MKIQFILSHSLDCPTNGRKNHKIYQFLAHFISNSGYHHPWYHVNNHHIVEIKAMDLQQKKQRSRSPLNSIKQSTLTSIHLRSPLNSIIHFILISIHLRGPPNSMIHLTLISMHLKNQ